MQKRPTFGEQIALMGLGLAPTFGAGIGTAVGGPLGGAAGQMAGTGLQQALMPQEEMSPEEQALIFQTNPYEAHTQFINELQQQQQMSPYAQPMAGLAQALGQQAGQAGFNWLAPGMKQESSPGGSLMDMEKMLVKMRAIKAKYNI